MINETKPMDLRFLLLGWGFIVGCILSLMTACSGTVRDAGVGSVKTSTTTSSVATSTKA